MSLASLPRSSGIVARRHASAVLAAGLALSPAAALAAETSAADSRAADAPASVEGVTVTGSAGGYTATNSLTRLPADLKEAPQSVTVLNRNLLQSQGVSSLSDALKNVPGITIGGAEGGQIGNNINLNGFTARTDIFMDGFRDRGQYYRDTFALDSVEVLMGPSSMLFGRGSTGGAINTVTKLPTGTTFVEGVVTGTTGPGYRMEVDSMTLGTRSFIINVNDGPDMTLNLSGGSGNLPFPTTIPVRLHAGMNTIQFGNPVSYPPDMDRIIISGDGNEP